MYVYCVNVGCRALLCSLEALYTYYKLYMLFAFFYRVCFSLSTVQRHWSDGPSSTALLASCVVEQAVEFNEIETSHTNE